jgi:beta-N-acetylhexosaminidase
MHGMSKTGDIKIGELFLLGYEPGEFGFLEDFARKFGLGGVVLFEKNFESKSMLAEQIRILNEITESRIIISVDQEGGPVNRIREESPLFPSAKYYGDRKDFAGLKTMAKSTAHHLLALGVNSNLVPVCDVLTNPRNTLMERRSYGSEADLVTQCTSELIQEYQHSGILCCAKHFPGLGSADIDPHENISTTDIGADEFRRVHWQPFARAIELRVDMVMTTHLLASDLDSENMATFSKKIVSSHLRDELGFAGVIITDDLSMGAVKNNFTPEESVCEALKAGHDMVMICHNREDQDSALNCVLECYNKGEMEKEEIENRISLVNKLKDKLKYNVALGKTAI